MYVTEREIYEGAIEKSGIEARIDVMIEEAAELINRLCKYRRNQIQEIEVEEKLAHVDICLEQMKLIFDASKIKMWKRIQLRRLEKTLED